MDWLLITIVTFSVDPINGGPESFNVDLLWRIICKRPKIMNFKMSLYSLMKLYQCDKEGKHFHFCSCWDLQWVEWHLYSCQWFPSWCLWWSFEVRGSESSRKKCIQIIIHKNTLFVLEANLILHLLEASVAFYQAIQNACSSSHWNVHAAILIFSNKTTKLWASNQVDITVVVGKMKGLILLVLLATITGIPENSCWTHPVWLISETDKGFFIIFSN